eukprot:SAG11_NODE_10060_length_860_cov_1.147175_1_plen_122_part_10
MHLRLGTATDLVMHLSLDTSMEASAKNGVVPLHFLRVRVQPSGLREHGVWGVVRWWRDKCSLVRDWGAPASAGRRTGERSAAAKVHARVRGVACVRSAAVRMDRRAVRHVHGRESGQRRFRR